MAVIRLSPAVALDYTADGWEEYRKWLDGTYATSPFLYADEGLCLSVVATDGIFYRTCSIPKPSEDARDFEDNFAPLSNRACGGGVINDGSVARAAVEAVSARHRTYSVEGALAGANNRDMLCAYNPVGSGKVIRVYETWATVPTSSGTTVIIPFELRKTSTLTGGTVVTPQKWDSLDAASAANIRTSPTGLTDQGLIYTFVVQINTAQGSPAAHTEVLHTGEATTPLKPYTLRPGEGIYLRQVANNTSSFRMGALFTEE